jgi:hypothetical protein
MLVPGAKVGLCIPRTLPMAGKCGPVRGAFDDGAAVGEEGHLIRLMPELQNELSVFHLPVGSEKAGDPSEVDGASALVNLYRVMSCG